MIRKLIRPSGQPIHQSGESGATNPKPDRLDYGYETAYFLKFDKIDAYQRETRRPLLLQQLVFYGGKENLIMVFGLARSGKFFFFFYLVATRQFGAVRGSGEVAD